MFLLQKDSTLVVLLVAVKVLHLLEEILGNLILYVTVKFVCKQGEMYCIFVFVVPPKPVNVTLSQSTNNKNSSLNVTWTVGVKSFIVSWYSVTLQGVRGTSRTQNTTSGGTFSMEFTNLIPGESYSATVQSFSFNGSKQSEMSTPSNEQKTGNLYLYIFIIPYFPVS